MSLRSLEGRLAKLEEKTGAKRPWSRAVLVVSHEHYPEDKFNAFLKENGVDPEDPEILLVHRRIVEPGRGSKRMFEPYFPDRGAPHARQPS